ncbi:hypothetical protein OG884_26525 [Streptosporangium sp. NBC_01755]|uniref:hypothetical protein n=1 Tax=Streptosporangium sp. NBC_01755 TaxID=2975949 RepID=UPI002DD8F928|nr:hypothetical protein [Streptosporangium sp. NBC_01755]WSC98405.1 hypothetical protein OG884_26525 [Streptosporangium sp. NBC_01755]
MAAPTFRAAGLGGTSTTTSTTVAKPGGTVTGDTLYALVSNGGASTAPTTVPSGWELVASGSISTTFWAGVYEHKVVDGGSEPANYTWSGFTDSCAGSMVGVVGADTTTPVHVFRAQATDDGHPACASITTTVADCLIVALVGTADNQLVGDLSWACATNPASLTERTDLLSSGGADTASAIATAPQTVTGPTGNFAATLAGSRDNVSFLLAIQPPQAGGGDVTGTATADLGGLTATAAGHRTVHSTVEAALGGLAAAAAGHRTVHGSALADLGALAATANNPAAGDVPGVAAANLAGLTATATGTRRVHGAAAGVLGALTAAAVGDRVVHGQAVATLSGLTATASAVRAIRGIAVANLGGLTATATGTVVGNVAGAAAAHLGPLTAVAAGCRRVYAAAAAPLGALTATAVAGRPPVSGVATATLGSLAATITGRRRIRAALTAPFGALTASASGRRTVHGAAALFGTLAATGRGYRTVYGSAGAPLGALTATASAGEHIPAPGRLAITTAPSATLTPSRSGSVLASATADTASLTIARTP